MGSVITLGIGKMEIDWGKNDMFRSYSELFQKTDVKKIKYCYVDEQDEEKLIWKRREGYSKPLKEVRNRLDLLGYSLHELKQQYEAIDNSCPILPYEVFFDLISRIDVWKTEMFYDCEGPYKDGNYDYGEYSDKFVLKKQIIKLPDGTEYKRKRKIAEYLESVDPLITLRILAENKTNLRYCVNWYYKDVVDAGWVKKEDIVRELDTKYRILIVTEGSSDTNILKLALRKLRPDTFDFYSFADMEGNYPFSGVGNLFNFCAGLVRIGIQNKCIVLFDNDTAGRRKYQEAKQLSLPENLCIIKLPDLSQFDSFETIGPSGTSRDNINGKAVAIECFLDFTCIGHSPQIRWTAYDSFLQQYQGELIGKENVSRHFFKHFRKDESYCVEKLEALISHIEYEWINRNFSTR